MSDQPLRILHLTSAAAPGGLSRYLIDLSAALRERGHDVRIAGDGGAWLDKFTAAGLPYITLPIARGPRGFFAGAKRLRQDLAGWSPDILHTHYRRATLLARRLQTRRRPPVLYTLHLSHMPVTGWRRLLVDWGDHTHLASQDAADWLGRLGVAAGDMTVVSHGIDTARYTPPTDEDRCGVRARFDLPADATVATYVGRLEDPKNVHWLPDVLRMSPKAYLLIAGDGPDRAMLETSMQEHASRVRLLGETDPLDVYRAADLLLLPSAREGFGLVAAEAMACGVPVLRTRTSGTTETILEGRTGLSTAIDRLEFTRAATALLGEPASLHAMRPYARRHVTEHLSFTRQVDETEALYRRLRR